MISPSILAKIKAGDCVADEELEAAIEFFSDMEHGLGLLGPQFDHPRFKLTQELERLNAFKRERARR